jgi:cohesin complex subunit SA-1/2
MRIMESRKGADEVRLAAATLLLDIYNMYRILKAKKSRIAKTPKKPQGRSSAAHDPTTDDWEALCRDIDSNTTRLLLHILTAWENSLAKLTNKRLEEPDIDDDPVDPDDEAESADEDETGDHALSDKRVRAVLVDDQLANFGARLVQGVLAGTLDNDSVRKRLERNKTKLTPTWREIVNALDTLAMGRQKKVSAKKTVKTPTKVMSKEVVEVDSEEEDEVEAEVPGDEIEDEDMLDGEEVVRTNGVEDGDAEEEREESILGD